MNNVDWEEQWALNAPSFKNGRALISIPNKEPFELLPGPGFGDLSHPTTQLMLEMMGPIVSNKTVFDIGCGSGVLSLAAMKWGALSCHSVDIDPDAIAHTQKNAFHNGLVLDFSPPTSPDVIVMNMIESEQKKAWESHKRPFHTLITSGVLTVDEERYLEFADEQRWHLCTLYRKNDWSGFIFTGDLKNEN